MPTRDPHPTLLDAATGPAALTRTLTPLRTHPAADGGKPHPPLFQGQGAGHRPRPPAERLVHQGAADVVGTTLKH